MSFSIRVSKQESELIRKYAALNNQSVSEVMRRAILEKIEDEFDIFLYDEAMNEHKNNGKTYTIAEAKQLLDLE